MGKQILVVDDDAMSIRMAEFILKKNFEYEVICVNSGEKCLQTLQHQEVDLILLDVEMPGMSGIETLEVIRKEDLAKNSTVVLLSGSDKAEIEQDMTRLQVMHYIKKPFIANQFVAQVKDLIEE